VDPVSRRETWPELLAELAELIGEELTLRLARSEGGLDRVYIPKRPTEGHAWARVVGEEAWTLIVGRYGGQQLALPRGSFLRLKKREILELSEQGLAPTEIARRVGAAVAYVRRVLGTGVGRRRAAVDPQQTKMFE
jgi:hypothetical protein